MDDSQKRNTSTSLEESTRISVVAELIDIIDRLMLLIYRQEELLEQSTILSDTDKEEMHNYISNLKSEVSETC